MSALADLHSRDIDFERCWTARAAELVGRDAAGLIVFAEIRSAGPVRDPDTRDFEDEALAAIASARNLVTWAAQHAAEDHHRDEAPPDHETVEALASATAHLVIAFDEVRRAQRRSSRHRHRETSA